MFQHLYLSCEPKERTINDLGGGSGKSKKNGYSPGKKNSTQQPGKKNSTTWKKINRRLARKKNSTAGWPEKKTQLPVGQEKKLIRTMKASGCLSPPVTILEEHLHCRGSVKGVLAHCSLCPNRVAARPLGGGGTHGLLLGGPSLAEVILA